MSLFLSETERAAIATGRRNAPMREIYWALLGRVERRARTPGFGPGVGADGWWYVVAEYLSDAAMAQALHPVPGVATWLRDITLSAVRRPLVDWVGPGFREHRTSSPVGHLETAHLTWGIAAVIDLVPDVFSEAERSEICGVLRDRGLAWCERWLGECDNATNWRCIMNAGAAVVAAVLDDRAAMQRAVEAFRLNVDLFQADGSYGESLQYGNYAALGLMWAREALTRRDPTLGAELPLLPYARKTRWDAVALLYVKPLAGWGAVPRARSINFGDSAALYRPSADVLLHLSARAREADAEAATLARSMFDKLYAGDHGQAPDGRATFGFVNDFGFLSLPLLTHTKVAPPLASVDLSTVECSDAGDVVVRDAWPATTVVAMRTGGAPLHSVAHHHGDWLSFQLAHNRERLLIDPGHACYRHLSRDLDTAAASHNTCTFELERRDGAPGRILSQGPMGKRWVDRNHGRFTQAVTPPAKRLLAIGDGDVRVIAAQAAAAYGDPIQSFRRFWFLCGAYALFVVDEIVAAEPVRATWHWHFNNRDDQLDLKLVQPDRLVARRGEAGCKVFHAGGGEMSGPWHTCVHDAYDPRPQQLGEGRQGAGQLVRWSETSAALSRVVSHAVCLGGPADITGWHFKSLAGSVVLEAPDGITGWKLAIEREPLRFVLTPLAGGPAREVEEESAGVWQLRVLNRETNL